MNKYESTEAYVARLEREIAQQRREAEEFAASLQPLAAEEEARQAALRREAEVAQQKRDEHSARLAQIDAELEAARRQAEDERIAKIRDAVESSEQSATLAERARINRETYGATGTDVRAMDIRLEAARIFEQVLGVSGTYELWSLMDPTVSAEMSLYGLRWSCFFVPGEGSMLRVDCGNHGPQPVPTLAELDRWACEQPAIAAALARLSETSAARSAKAATDASAAIDALAAAAEAS